LHRNPLRYGTLIQLWAIIFIAQTYLQSDGSFVLAAIKLLKSMEEEGRTHDDLTPG
jgi:hypothetical protein